MQTGTLHPTIGLDVIAKQRIRAFIKEMNAQGTTFILTTHDLEDVEQLAQKIVIINHGKKVFDDTLQNLQLNLGAKKIIHLTLINPVSDIKIDGVKVIENHLSLKIPWRLILKRTLSICL